jgi:hypothetical protein
MVNPFKILAALELEAGTALLEEVTKGLTKDGDVTKLLEEIYDKQKQKLTKPKRRRRRRPKGYIWMTLHDSRVRSAHRALHGKYILWSSPPVAGTDGRRYHAGRAQGCRCFPMGVRTKDQVIKADWVDDARQALGRIAAPELSAADEADIAKKNRRTLLEQLRASIPSAPTPVAKGPVRRVKRVVWRGEK